ILVLRIKDKTYTRCLTIEYQENYLILVLHKEVKEEKQDILSIRVDIQNKNPAISRDLVITGGKKALVFLKRDI
ncbi:MAG: hypothetical protein ACERKX_08625, partial [Anaerolineales bacterium]